MQTRAIGSFFRLRQGKNVFKRRLVRMGKIFGAYVKEISLQLDFCGLFALRNSITFRFLKYV